MFFVATKTWMGSSSMIQVVLIFFIPKVYSKNGALVNFTIHLYFSAYSLYLIFCNEETNTFCIFVVVEGFIHSK